MNLSSNTDLEAYAKYELFVNVVCGAKDDRCTVEIESHDLVKFETLQSGYYYAFINFPYEN